MYSAVKVNEEKCTGCKLCVFSCPDPNVFTVLKNKKVSVDPNRCKGCGLCASVCPKDALSVN